MNITELVIGFIYKLNENPGAGSQYVQIVSIDGEQIEAATGVFSARDGFRRKTFQVNGKPVRHITLTAEQFAAFIAEGEIMQNEKDAAGEAGETHVVPVDENGNEVEGPKKPMTAQEKIDAIKQAEKDKIEAIKTKEKAREDAATDKRVGKLKEAAEKAGIKEPDVAAEYGAASGAKSFKSMTEAETKTALEGLKVKAKEKAAADKEVTKNATKLTAAAEKAGVKEGDIAAEYSAAREAGPVKKFDQLTSEEVTLALAGLKEKAKDKAKADALALKTSLTDEEAAELKVLEKIVDKNVASFQAAGFQIGGALQAINQKRLYRGTEINGVIVKTFEEYVQGRFGLSRPHAYSVMTAAQTFAALTEGIEVDAKNLPSITAAEAISRGVKGLLKEAGLADDPEVDAVTRQMVRNVHALAVQNAPKDKDGQPILSPGHLSSTFSVLNEMAKTGLVEIDGAQVPVNLAAASIDEMITEESHERVERMKASLADRITASEAASKEAKPSRLDAALNSATGNGVEIPTGVVPKLTVICSVHGRNEMQGSGDNDVTLGCGCVFVSTPEGYLFDEESRKPAAA